MSKYIDLIFLYQIGSNLPGDGKALLSLEGLVTAILLTASKHTGHLTPYRLNRKPNLFKLLPGNGRVMVIGASGRVSRQEYLPFQQFIPLTVGKIYAFE